MKIGHVRVSKQEQNEELQINALKEAGCEKWFLDKITGSKAECKGLDEALASLRSGDVLVVWKLDRAGRSLSHLIDLLRSLKERGVGHRRGICFIIQNLILSSLQQRRATRSVTTSNAIIKNHSILMPLKGDLRGVFSFRRKLALSSTFRGHCRAS